MSARIPSNAPQARALVDLRVIAAHGTERDRLLTGAEAELEAIVDELVRVREAGGRVNVALAARLAGVTRDTIYARLRARRSSTENTTTGGTP